VTAGLVAGTPAEAELDWRRRRRSGGDPKRATMVKLLTYLRCDDGIASWDSRGRDTAVEVWMQVDASEESAARAVRAA
jgi:hypothetical protein